MNMYIFLLVFLGSMLLSGFIFLAIDRVFKTHYSCDLYGWHNGQNGPAFFDGCSIHAKCNKCGKEVMQDGQGNWF